MLVTVMGERMEIDAEDYISPEDVHYMSQGALRWTSLCRYLHIPYEFTSKEAIDRMAVRAGRLTDKQQQSINDMIARFTAGYGVHIPGAYALSLSFAEEVRPHRGCDVTVHYSDGEFTINAGYDVYGNGYESIGNVDMIHSSSDDECDCTPCTTLREQEDFDFEHSTHDQTQVTERKATDERL